MTAGGQPPAEALEGVRVLDLSTGPAGSIAAMCLADFGAEVVRVEDSATTKPMVHEALWHRNKAILNLDIRSASGREQRECLLAGADVAVVTGRPSTELRAEHHPRLITLSMPSAPRGAPWPVDGDSPEFLAAVSGVARRQSSHNGGPIESVFPHLLYEHGLWAAAVAVAALLERCSSGRGQVLEVDGMHAVLVAATATMVIDPNADVPSTAVGPGGPNPVYSTYRCADDEWIFLAALTPKFQDVALDVLGLGHLLEDRRLQGDRARLFAPDNRGWLRESIGAVMRTRPRDEWLAVLNERGCPVAHVGDSMAWLDHPQVRALEIPQTYEDPDVGSVTVPRLPVDLSRTPVRSPDGRRVVDEAPQWPAQEPVATRASDDGEGVGPLHGFRVLDLGTVLAGPYAGTLLAELGADVVKVEPLTGDPFRTTGFHYNRGQRSLAVDLRQPAGREAFVALARTADVVIDNFRPGVRERLGISHEDLTHATARETVSVSISGYGSTGPMGGQPGFDPVLQAMSGMMSAQGGDAAPVFFSIPVNDVTAACAAVLGAGVGLYHRHKTGTGQSVEVTLTAVSAFMQFAEIARYSGRPSPPRGGRDYTGPSALDRYYRTQDGYVRVRAEHFSQLVDAGVVTRAADDGEAGEPMLETAFASLATAEALARLMMAGVSAVSARTLHDLVNDETFRAEDYVEGLAGVEGPELAIPGRYARLSRTQRSGSMIPPGTGQHTRELLSEAGYTRESVELLLRQQVVADGPPMDKFAAVSYR